ncbi:phage antirepressor protein [Rhodococcus hoagii]|nr:phage antirepressor protein [Prescottella equi]
MHSRRWSSSEREDARVLAEAKVAELEPAAAAWESLADAEGDYSLREAAQILSRDPAINTGQNRLAKSLRELGVLDRRGEPYQTHINHIRRRPTAYTHPHTGEPKLSSQLRITVPGLRYLHGKLGGTRPLRLDIETGSAVALA